MWILELFSAGLKRTYHLVGGCEYTIGRLSCDIELFDNDPSVSRHHASLIASCSTHLDLIQFNRLPQCFLVDHSKHGSFLNGERLGKEAGRRPISHEDVISFGRHAWGQLWFTPAIVVFSRTLREMEYKQGIEALSRLGGYHLPEPVSHAELQRQLLHSPFAVIFCTESLDTEPDALMALLFRYSVVTASFLNNLFVLLRDAPQLPLSVFPQQSIDAPTIDILKDVAPARQVPELWELREFHLQLPFPPDALLRMQQFCFLDEVLMLRYRVALFSAGAHVTLLDLSAPLAASTLPSSAFLVVSASTFAELVVVLSDPAVELSARLTAPMLCWKVGMKVLDERNLLLCLLSHDAVSHLHPLAPGVLFRDEMKDGSSDDDDAESTDTVEKMTTSQGTCAVTLHSPIQVVPRESSRDRDGASQLAPLTDSLYAKWTLYLNQ